MRKTRSHKNNGYIVCVFFMVIITSWYIFISLPVIKTYTSAEVRSLIEKAINISVSNVINRTLSYDSLIDIHYTNDGEILSFSANQYEINSITREIIKESQYQLDNLSREELKINLGTMSGIPFLIGTGPKVNLKLIPIGDVTSRFDSEFSSVGINITKHTLFLYVNVHASIVLPIKSYDIHSSNQVLLAESIIVGKVPQVYLDGAGIGKSLNLVP